MHNMCENALKSAQEYWVPTDAFWTQKKSLVHAELNKVDQ